MSSAPTTTSTPPPQRPTVSRCGKMNIGCFSETKKLANGRCIKSDALVAGDHSWRIAFYPNGRLAGTTGFVSHYLLLDDAGAVADDDVHVKFRFMLYEVGGGPPRFRSAKVAGAFSRRRKEIGFEHFVSLEDLEKSGFLKHDRFTIGCELTVQTPPTSGLPDHVATAPPPPSAPPEPSVDWAAPPEAAADPPVPSTPPEPPAGRTPPSESGLHAGLGRLLQTKEGADVDFEVSGKVFAAHKIVLAARSPVFKADFFGPMKEKTTSYIRICDMHPDAFEALLHYMYTDSLPEMTLNSREEGAVLAEGLLVAADRYNLKDLKSATENKMCNHIGVSTVLPMLALAEQHRCCKLKKMCLEFIASRRNTRATMATDDVEHLARSCPSVVKEVITEILDTREATPDIDISCFLYALIFVLPLIILLYLR